MPVSQEAKEGWDFIAKAQSTGVSANMGGCYVKEVDVAIQQITDDFSRLSKNGLDPERLKGFIAEYWHADTFNLNAALKGVTNRAYVEGSTVAASVDVSSNFGKNYSLKYYATGKESVLQQAKNVIQNYHEYLAKSKSSSPMSFDEYLLKNGYSGEMSTLLQSVYSGQYRIIPSDQLKCAIEYLNQQIVKESMKDGPNRAAILANYKETLEKLTDRISDEKGVESTPLTKEEAEAMAVLCKEGNFKAKNFGFDLSDIITTEYVLQQALKAGMTSMIITLVMQVGPEIIKSIDYLVKNGYMDCEQIRETGLKTLSSTSEGFLRGSISSALAIVCRSGKFGSELMKAPTSIIGAITVIVLDAVKSSCMVVCKKMTVQQMDLQLTKTIALSAMSVAGGTAGQTLLPGLPVFGYMLGSLVGSIIGSLVINTNEKIFLSFCAKTGFSFFGLVEQDYHLPEEVLKRLGVEVVDFKHVEYKQTHYKEASYKTVSYKHQEYATVEFTVLRRGVIEVNTVGYTALI